MTTRTSPALSIPVTARMVVMTRRAWKCSRLVRYRLIPRTRTRIRLRPVGQRGRSPSTTRPSPLPSRGHSSSLSGSPGSCMPPEVCRFFTYYTLEWNLTTICTHRGAGDYFSTYDQGSSPVFGRFICAPHCASALPRRPADRKGDRACFWVICYARYVGI
jgi:hypothetical protein